MKTANPGKHKKTERHEIFGDQQFDSSRGSEASEMDA